MENKIRFKEIILELTEFFDELTGLEKIKLDAISENNMKLLEECMSKEQVGIMRLRVLEKHRDEIQQKMGLGGLSFREIVARFDGEEKEELERMYYELADALTLFNHTADSAKNAIESNLYSIEAILARLRQKQYGKQAASENGFSSKRA
ncbi:MAG: flagellar export chaperone FlgN [Peptostreptococcaceae bacterium]|nr:flagellar export chaperone FlgN [Peptostreptococcaceae bacterium]